MSDEGNTDSINQRTEHSARKAFIMGCMGLPLLWIFNIIYHYPSIKSKTASRELCRCELDENTIPNYHDELI